MAQNDNENELDAKLRAEVARVNALNKEQAKTGGQPELSDDLAVARVFAASWPNADGYRALCELARTACLAQHHQRLRGCSIPGCTFYVVRNPDDDA